MVKVIKETQDYLIQVGPGLEEPHTTCYQLINRVYDVVEVETQLLPQAFEYLDQLQAGLDAMRDMETSRKEEEDKRNIAQFPH